jgi:hypothetical protein
VIPLAFALAGLAPSIFEHSAPQQLAGQLHRNRAAFYDKGEDSMSAGIGIRTKQDGAITIVEILYDGCLIATLFRNGSHFVDYFRQRSFDDLDVALEFYGTQSLERPGAPNQLT